MPHLLWISDLHHTGYATLAKNMIRAVNRYNHEICISLLAINHNLDRNQLITDLRRELPQVHKIYAVENLMVSGHTVNSGEFAKYQLLGLYELLKISKEFQPDYIFCMNDNIAAVYLKAKWAFPNSKFICYMPVDSGDIPFGFFDCLCQFDQIITMNKFGMVETQRSIPYYTGNIDYLYPIQSVNYHPLNDKKLIRKQWLPESQLSNFVLLNINMNQQRKRLDLTLQAFHRFNKVHPDSTLVLKSKNTSVEGIPDINQYVRVNYSDIQNNIILVDRILTEQELNQLYNIADVFVTTSIAEGWGFTPCEAALAGCPVLTPRHTSFIEIFDAIGNCYNAKRVPWNFKGVTNNFGNNLILLATATRKTAPTRNVQYLESLPTVQTDSVLISAFGKDIYPQKQVKLSNIPIVAVFDSLKTMNKYIDSILSTRNCVNIYMQLGNDCGYFTEQMIHNSTSPVDKPLVDHPEFDLQQIRFQSLAGNYISNYIPDLDNLHSKLLELYDNRNSPLASSKQLLQWFQVNCDEKVIADRFVQLIKK